MPMEVDGEKVLQDIGTWLENAQANKIEKTGLDFFINIFLFKTVQKYDWKMFPTRLKSEATGLVHILTFIIRKACNSSFRYSAEL